MAHTRHSRPDSGLGFQVNILITLEVVPSSLGSGPMINLDRLGPPPCEPVSLSPSLSRSCHIYKRLDLFCAGDQTCLVRVIYTAPTGCDVGAIQSLWISLCTQRARNLTSSGLVISRAQRALNLRARPAPLLWKVHIGGLGKQPSSGLPSPLMWTFRGWITRNFTGCLLRSRAFSLRNSQEPPACI